MFSIQTTTRLVNVAKAYSPTTSKLIAQRALKTKASGPQAEVKQLKAKLQKEKKKLADYKSKHDEKAKLLKTKEKSRKDKAKEDLKKVSDAEAKLIKKATKAYRNLSGLNLFVKEKCTATNTLKDVNGQWALLSVDEKAVYTDRAAKVNEENRKIWTDGPKKPTTSYGNFVKENWRDLGDFKKSSQAVSEAWKALSVAEKNAFKPDSSALEAFKKAHEAWVAQRVKLYKEKVGSS